MSHAMNSVINVAKISLDVISFLALMLLLFWLLGPSIPGVHLNWFWDFVLGLLGIYGFYALVAWSHKSSTKKAPFKAP